MNKFILLFASIFLVACQSSDDAPPAESPAEPAVVAEEAPDVSENTLAAVLDAQPDEVKARYQYRHPDYPDAAGTQDCYCRTSVVRAS
jgi:hypothetical protein